MTCYYKLDVDGRTPVPTTMEEGARLFEDNDARRVAYDEVGDLIVSTVFLVIDHNHFGGGPPLLFETMVFRETTRSEGLFQERTATWDEAVRTHARALADAYTRIRR